MKEYSGSRWYKCDLHLHTMCSPCYTNKEDTAEQWVARALEQGLTVAAVTDHNDYRGIKGVLEEGKKQGLAVFPGVEITCDSTKIHMLILFDTDKNEETVRDFLNRCDIDSECMGSTGGTTMSVLEICQIAKKRGALVIAAHIDEFSSISSMNPASLDKLLAADLLDAVQVANVPIWEKYQTDKDAESMYAVLGEKYGADATPAEIERWRKCYVRAQEAGLPMLAFSDNPADPQTGNHGLWGIGSVYTWIQMDHDVDLESLRQSLISPANRIRMSFDSPEQPKTEPDFWIRSMEVRQSLLNPHLPIHLDFHPQLNCIIGGRGSGKSAMIMILKGVYRQLTDCQPDSMARLQDSFYRMADENGQGIFKEDSEVEICFSWFGSSYRMVVSGITDADHQQFSFFRQDEQDHTETEETWDDLRFRSLMSAQVFTERELNALCERSDRLLAYIDSLMNDMYILQARKQYYMDRLVNYSEKVRAEEKLISDSYRINAELEWFQSLEEDQVPSTWQQDVPAMISRRSQAAELLDERMHHLFEIKEEQKQLLKNYEETLAEIHQMRTAYISRVLKDDENYKIELQAMADKESLHRMLADRLGVDLSLIREDLDQLEKALFAKKGGLSKYQELITSVRKQAFHKSEEDLLCSAYFTHLIGKLSAGDFEYVRLFHPEDKLCLFYHPTGVKRFFPLDQASAGEKATAMFSFFLQSRIVPFIIDQPETDMDNHVIYAEILAKLKKVKQNRQLILATHNPILTTNADAGMIIAMDASSKFVRVKAQGTVDSTQIRHEICDIIEGSEYAFWQRAKKYHIKQ